MRTKQPWMPTFVGMTIQASTPRRRSRRSGVRAAPAFARRRHSRRDGVRAAAAFAPRRHSRRAGIRAAPAPRGGGRPAWGHWVAADHAEYITRPAAYILFI
jgi:hypothetical protein